MTATTPETVYLALSCAADRIGAYCYNVQRTASKAKRFRMNVHPGHAAICDAMLDVMNGAMSIENAMSLLHYGEGAELLHRARLAGY